MKERLVIKGSRFEVDEKSKENLKEDVQRKLDFSQEERNKRLKKEIKRLGKRMQDALKDDNFIESC